MFGKIGLGQVLIGTVLILVGAGATWGIMTWLNRPMAGSPAAEMQLGGPVIPGLCVLSRQAVFDLSQVGKVANGQYKVLRDAAQGQVNGDEGKIVADAKALEAQKGSLSAGEFQQRQQDLNQRLQALRQEAAVDSRDMEATRQDIVVRISKEVQPVIAAVYKDKHCGLLIERGLILAGNPAMDITAAVIAGLDARITSVPVERKHVEIVPGQPAK